MQRLRVLATLAVAFLFAAFPVAAFADTSFSQYLGQLEQEYQLPSGILWKVALVENGGKATGCAPTSSACGMYQFITSTWESATKAMFGRPLDPSLRNSPDVSAKVAAYELAVIKYQIGGTIQQANVNLSAGLYLGHFLGSGGARVLLSAYMQNRNQSACSLLASACAANRSILNQSVAGVINYASQKMQVTGVPNIPGNFADDQGVSYAYSYADINSSNLLPVNTVIPANPYGQYATVFPASVSNGSSIITTSPIGTTLPSTLPTQTTPTQSTIPGSATSPASGSAASGPACTPKYYCSNNTIYYQSDSCSASVFQACMYGCLGTICAPSPAVSSTSASLYTQSSSPLGTTLQTSGSIGSPVIVGTPASSTGFASDLGSTINTIIDNATGPAQGEATSAPSSFNATTIYNTDTLTASNVKPYAPITSPLFSILNQLRSALTSLLSYLGSL